MTDITTPRHPGLIRGPAFPSGVAHKEAGPRIKSGVTSEVGNVRPGIFSRFPQNQKRPADRSAGLLVIAHSRISRRFLPA